MYDDKINIISTALIAYLSTVGLMTGLYFNMKPLNIGLFYIILFELMFTITIFIFIIWIKKRIKNEA